MSGCNSGRPLGFLEVLWSSTLPHGLSCSLPGGYGDEDNEDNKDIEDNEDILSDYKFIKHNLKRRVGRRYIATLLLPLTCHHLAFEVNFCQFGVNFCEFVVNFCEFEVNFCEFGVSFCEFGKNLCEFEESTIQKINNLHFRAGAEKCSFVLWWHSSPETEEESRCQSTSRCWGISI